MRVHDNYLRCVLCQDAFPRKHGPYLCSQKWPEKSGKMKRGLQGTPTPRKKGTGSALQVRSKWARTHAKKGRQRPPSEGQVSHNNNASWLEQRLVILASRNTERRDHQDTWQVGSPEKNSKLSQRWDNGRVRPQDWNILQNRKFNHMWLRYNIYKKAVKLVCVRACMCMQISAHMELRSQKTNLGIPFCPSPHYPWDGGSHWTCL